MAKEPGVIPRNGGFQQRVRAGIGEREDSRREVRKGETRRKDGCLLERMNAVEGGLRSLLATVRMVLSKRRRSQRIHQQARTLKL
eukprot:gene17163-biopygen6778